MISRLRLFSVLVLLWIPAGVQAAETTSLWQDFLAANQFDQRSDPRLAIDIYQAILHQFALRLDSEAVQLLVEMESRMSLRPKGCLRHVESHQLELLAKIEPETLPLALTLHAVAWNLHYKSGRTAYHEYALDLVNRWTAHYSKTSVGRTADGQGNLAADFLVWWSMILEAQRENHLFAEVKRQLENALKLDRSHPVALQLLSFHLERRGEYSEVIKLQERHLAAHPGDHQALLRLAINRLRRGDREAKAEETLEALGREATAEEWVRRVALQEWANTAEGLTAYQRLEQALRVFPDDVTLNLQLAHHLRSSGAAASNFSRQLIESYEDDPGISPRARYNMTPTNLVEAHHRHMHRSLEERRDLLVQTLESSPDPPKVLAACPSQWKVLQ